MNKEIDMMLEELQNAYAFDEEKGQLVYLPLDKLHPHPDNPRKEIGDVTELADSIKSKGVMQNLTVVPAKDGYTVIIGHRRCAAAKLAGLKEVPCVIVEMSDREQVATMLLENMQRVDLTPYEQAAGFQMMMDFGESVDTISDKTGFSKRTVKRRLKMAELDQEILHSVSDRQISLDDFDKLAQVEDIKKRNEILKDIGTNNFNHRVQAQIISQKTKKNIPMVTETIKRVHGNKMAYSETYSGDYIKIFETKISEYEGDYELPDDRKSEKIFYYWDESYNIFKLYVRAPKATPVKRSAKEIESEKRIARAHDTLEALTSEAYSLRKTFIRELKPTKDQKDEMLKGAVYACLREQYQYNSHVNKTEMYTEVSGADIDVSNYNASYRLDQILEAYKKNNKRAMVGIIYASLENASETRCHTTYKGEYPKYSRNRGLELLYDWLCSLGYQMSDMEKSLIDGTHPIFKEDTNE